MSAGACVWWGPIAIHHMLRLGRNVCWCMCVVGANSYSPYVEIGKECLLVHVCGGGQ